MLGSFETENKPREEDSSQEEQDCIVIFWQFLSSPASSMIFWQSIIVDYAEVQASPWLSKASHVVIKSNIPRAGMFEARAAMWLLRSMFADSYL